MIRAGKRDDLADDGRIRSARLSGLGDNVYLDATERRDVRRLHSYRRMLRQEYREFVAQTAIDAVWDDHDMDVA